jgi:hypothetical protein
MREPTFREDWKQLPNSLKAIFLLSWLLGGIAFWYGYFAFYGLTPGEMSTPKLYFTFLKAVILGGALAATVLSLSGIAMDRHKDDSD